MNIETIDLGDGKGDMVDEELKPEVYKNHTIQIIKLGNGKYVANITPPDGPSRAFTEIANSKDDILVLAKTFIENGMHIKRERDEQSIELDCPPGNPRPGDLIGVVIKGTGLPEREAVSRFFGNWKWDYSDIPPQEWDKIRPILKERIERLYNSGSIRYGSW